MGGEFPAPAALRTRRAEVNAKDEKGITPLAMAENRGRKAIASLLRQHGATE